MPRRKPEYHLQTFYGQLQRIFVVDIPISEILHTTHPTTVILAEISPCKIESTHPRLDIHYYSKCSTSSVLDITCVQCLVGRVPDGKQWAVIDRSGALARAVVVGDDNI